MNSNNYGFSKDDYRVMETPLKDLNEFKEVYSKWGFSRNISSKDDEAVIKNSFKDLTSKCSLEKSLNAEDWSLLK